MIDGLDYEAQRWTYLIDVLVHNLFHNGSLAGVVQATIRVEPESVRNILVPTA